MNLGAISNEQEVIKLKQSFAGRIWDMNRMYKLPANIIPTMPNDVVLKLQNFKKTITKEVIEINEAIDAAADGNGIYTADGTLSGNRVVTLGGNTLNFTGASGRTLQYTAAGGSGATTTGWMMSDTIGATITNQVFVGSSFGSPALEAFQRETSNGVYSSNGTRQGISIDRTSADMYYTNTTSSAETRISLRPTVINIAGNVNFDTNTLFVDATNNRVGIGTITPSSKIDVTTTALGVAQVDTSGISLVNTTAAAAGAQQISPALRFRGQG